VSPVRAIRAPGRARPPPRRRPRGAGPAQATAQTPAAQRQPAADAPCSAPAQRQQQGAAEALSSAQAPPGSSSRLVLGAGAQPPAAAPPAAEPQPMRAFQLFSRQAEHDRLPSHAHSRIWRASRDDTRRQPARSARRHGVRSRCAGPPLTSCSRSLESARSPRGSPDQILSVRPWPLRPRSTHHTTPLAISPRSRGQTCAASL